MFDKTENLIGLDIGSHSVKMVQVNIKNTTIKLLNLGLASVPRDAFAEGRLSNVELIAKTVRQLAHQLKIKEKSTAASISGYEVMIKKIEMPMMTEEELDSRMQTELGQYIPYNIDEVDVDYQILDISKNRPNYMEVLLVAAKKESINDHVSLVKLAGLSPMVIDVDFFALGNAFEATYGLKGDENIALIDIGAHKAIISIISRGVPVFTRGISLGGFQITDRIQDQLRLAEEQAERAKMGEIPSGVAVEELEGIFVTVIKNWVNELKRAIDFYYSNFPDNSIEKIYLSGGSCRIAGLDQVFKQNMNTEVEIFNPIARLDYDSKAFDPAYIDYIGPQMAIALGLALRKTKEK